MSFEEWCPRAFSPDIQTALSLQTPHLQGRGHSSICHSRWRLTIQGREVTSSLKQSILFPLLLEREVIPKLEHPVGGDREAAALTLGVHPGPGNGLALLIYTVF